ncbi:HNH endonuclease [Candidatus Dojkabacteria bacterium]|uniref:HNH endonuclease n=1 Tax=Candidatus Dojkabacteria bacterium TaxID=2099670 RepID=A0A847VDW6_9BACT|nr:HNH endonuclease [Candidatus Dojkabacteria bacterium]
MYYKKAVRKRDVVCQNCGIQEENEENPFTIHHIQPRCYGGTNSPNNLILLCTKCHRNLHKTQGYPIKRKREGGRRKKRKRRRRKE